MPGSRPCCFSQQAQQTLGAFDMRDRFSRSAVIHASKKAALRTKDRFDRPLLRLDVMANVSIGQLALSGPKAYISIASAIARASSNSTPRYRTVLSIFVCPKSN